MASLDNKPYHFNEESSKRLCEELGIEYTGPMVMSFSPELTKKLCEAVASNDSKTESVSFDVRQLLDRGKMGTRYKELVDGAPLELEGDELSFKLFNDGHGTYLSHTEGQVPNPSAEDLVPSPAIFDSPLNEHFVVDPVAVVSDPGIKIKNAGFSGVCTDLPHRLNIDDTNDVRIEMFNDEEIDAALKVMNDFSIAVTSPFVRGFKLKKEPLAGDPVDPVNVHAMVEHAIRTLARNGRIMTSGEASNMLSSKKGINDHFHFIALERAMPDILEWFNNIIKVDNLTINPLQARPKARVEEWRQAVLQVSKGITFHAIAPNGFETYSDIFKWINSIVALAPEDTGLVFVFSD